MKEKLIQSITRRAIIDDPETDPFAAFDRDLIMVRVRWRLANAPTWKGVTVVSATPAFVDMAKRRLIEEARSTIREALIQKVHLAGPKGYLPA